MSILTVPSKKWKHPPSADVFISWDSATQRAAPPSSDWNARAKWIRPAPRFCLRQKARTAQKRRRPEGQLGTSQVKSQTTLEGSELLPPATSEQSSLCSDVFMPTAEKTSSVHSFEPSFQTRSTGFGLLPPLCGDSILLRRNINFNGSLQGCVAVPGLSTKERRDQKSGDDSLLRGVS